MLDLNGSVDQSDPVFQIGNSIIADPGSTVVLDTVIIHGGNIIAQTGGTLDVGTDVTLDGAAHPVFLSGTLPVDAVATLTLTGDIGPYVGTPATIDATQGLMYLAGATVDRLHILVHSQQRW